MRLQHTKQKVLLLNLMLSAAKYQKSSTKFLLCHHASSNAVQICDFQKKPLALPNCCLMPISMKASILSIASQSCIFLLNHIFNLPNASSIGLKSGEYGGRY